MSKNDSSKKQAVDRTQAIVKWAGNEAAATGVSAAMVAAGVATVIPGAIAVRKTCPSATKFWHLLRI